VGKIPLFNLKALHCCIS